MAVGIRPPHPPQPIIRPSFVSRVRHPLDQQGLMIPPSFFGMYGGNLGENVVLYDDSGAYWDVKMTRMEGGGRFLTDLADLGRHHSVQIGDLVFFRLIDHSQLQFTVYDRHGVPK